MGQLTVSSRATPLRRSLASPATPASRRGPSPVRDPEIRSINIMTGPMRSSDQIARLAAPGDASMQPRGKVFQISHLMTLDWFLWTRTPGSPPSHGA